jgi:nucleoside-diphosphate-sugar epimerase
MEGVELMRVLVTGHDGYIGHALVPMLQAAGHEVTGLDSFLYVGCDFPAVAGDVPAMPMDVRDVEVGDLIGFDAVIHLAALSNDPLGDLDESVTYEVNHLATVRLAEYARAAGVRRFLFSSSCSNYGAASDDLRTEDSECNPITTYGISKVLAERDLAELASADFSPIFLRNATGYGVTPRLRVDLVVNNLVAYAWATGEVLIKSDGEPWRPLIHVEDIARAFRVLLEAPLDEVHNQVFNVGATEENYRVRDVAELVREIVPGSRITYANDAMADFRNYRVDCDKLASRFPEARPRWTVRAGIEQLHDMYRTSGLTPEELLGDRFLRIDRIRRLADRGDLDPSLRWVGSPPARTGIERASA